MIREKRISPAKTIPLLLIGLLIFILYLYFLVGLEGIAFALQRANSLFYSLAFVNVFLSMLFYSLAWQYLLLPLSMRPPFRKTFLYTWVGVFVDLLIPAEAISGDISKTYLMSKSSGGNTGKVFASLIGQRIINMSIVLGALIVGSILFLAEQAVPSYILNLLFIVVIGTATTLFFLCLLSLREHTTWRIIDGILRFAVFLSGHRWNLDQLRSKARNMLTAFRQGMEVLGRNPRTLVWPIVFSLGAWIFHLIISYIVFLSLGQLVPLSLVIIASSVSDSIQMVPLGIPGEIGLTDIVMVTLYTFLGLPLEISQATAAAATVLIRIVTFWFRLVVGFLAAQRVGVKILMGK